MVGRTNGDGGKGLGVLVFGTQTLGQQVIQRFVKGNRNEIGCLHIAFCIDNRVSERELDVLDRHEGEHIRRHELVCRTIFPTRHAFFLALAVIIG